MEVVAIPAFADNYIWAIVHTEKQCCILVDPGCPEAALDFLRQHHYQLTDVLITHYHPDHTGALAELREQYAPVIHAPPHPSLPKNIHLVYDNEILDLAAYGLKFSVIATPGHTLDHVCYSEVDQGWLFSGDTLFAGGCGRLFQGTAEQMYASLNRLCDLAPNTQIYCAHEYTEANLRFALSVEPDNIALQQSLASVKTQCARNQITLPSTLLTELRTNPFLRCDQVEFREQLAKHLNQPCFSPIQAFTQLRAHKDQWNG